MCATAGQQRNKSAYTNMFQNWKEAYCVRRTYMLLNSLKNCKLELPSVFKAVGLQAIKGNMPLSPDSLLKAAADTTSMNMNAK